MENFFYTLVLVGGSALAYYLVFYVGKKLAPSEVFGFKLPKAITFILQIILPAVLLPLLASGALKNIDKMFEVTQTVGNSPYLSIVTDLFEGAEDTNKVWAMLSLVVTFVIFKHVIKNMPDNPNGAVSFGLALLVVVLVSVASSVLWDIVAEKIWLKTLTFFDSIWWDTTPGAIIREWIFPNQQRIP